MSRYAKTEESAHWLEEKKGLHFYAIGRCTRSKYERYRYESKVTPEFRRLYKSIGKDPQGRVLSGQNRLRNVGIYLYKQTDDDKSRFYNQWVVGFTLSHCNYELRTEFVPDKFILGNKKKEVPSCTHDGMDVIVADAQTWMTDRVPRPDQTFDLRESQQRAYAFCMRRLQARDSAMLSLDMGGGKTRTTLALATAMKAQNILCVGPAAALQVWSMEMRKCGLKGRLAVCTHSIIIDPDKEVEVRRFNGPRERAEIVPWLQESQGLRIISCTYQLLATMAKNKEIDETWLSSHDLLVLDECHYVKNGDTKTWQVLNKLSRNIPKRLLLSGTPVAHSGRDMAMELQLMDPGLYKSTDDFLAAWRCVFNPSTNISRRQKCIDLFAAMAATWCTSVDTGIVLPEAKDHIVSLAPTEAQIKDLSYLAANAKDEKLDIGEYGLVRRQKMAMVSGGAMCGKLDDHEDVVVLDGIDPETPKAEHLSGIMDDHIARNDPMAVFTRFIAEVEFIVEMAKAKNMRVGIVDGRNKSGLQGSVMREDIDIIVVQSESGAEGIDLTRCNHMVFYTLSDSMAKHMQSRKRIHRPGQERECTFTYLIMEDPALDQRQLDNIQARNELAKTLMVESMHNTTGDIDYVDDIVGNISKSGPGDYADSMSLEHFSRMDSGMLGRFLREGSNIYGKKGFNRRTKAHEIAYAHAIRDRGWSKETHECLLSHWER